MIYSATDFLKVELGIGFIQIEQTKLALHRSIKKIPGSPSCSSLQGIELGVYVTKLWIYNKCLHKRVDETKLRVPIDSRIVQDGEYTKGSEILYSTIDCVCAADLIPEDSRLCTHAQVLQ